MTPLRLDRLFSLYAVRPVRRILQPRGRAAPILMYHSVSTLPEKRAHPYFNTVTSPQTFASHMAILKQNGYRAVSVSKALQWLGTPAPATDKVVAITFDDGFADFEESALPALQAQGFCATVFLPTALMGKASPLLGGATHLSWERASALTRDGVLFGSHSVSHRPMGSLTCIQIASEVTDSKKAIEDRLQQPVDCFSCPYALPDGNRDAMRSLTRSLIAAGYTCGVTTRIGLATPSDPPLLLRRVPNNGFDDRDLFLAKLAGDYDWMGAPQTVTKHIKGQFSRLLGR